MITAAQMPLSRDWPLLFDMVMISSGETVETVRTPRTAA